MRCKARSASNRPLRFRGKSFQVVCPTRLSVRLTNWILVASLRHCFSIEFRRLAFQVSHHCQKQYSVHFEATSEHRLHAKVNIRMQEIELRPRLVWSNCRHPVGQQGLLSHVLNSYCISCGSSGRRSLHRHMVATMSRKN
jgi:hypothetical protein